MTTFNIREAKTHLSRLVERAAHGETFIIPKAGKATAKLVPISATDPKAKRLGFLKGAVQGTGFRSDGRNRDRGSFRRHVIKLPPSREG
jgi:prevent-host-death family protein